MAIVFSVFKPADRTHYQVQWVDPISKRKRTKSTGETQKRAAEKFAAEHIKALESREGLDGDVSWTEFRDAHDSEVAQSLAPETRRLYGTVFNHLEKHVDPGRMSDITSRQLSRLQAKWRSDKKSEFTIRTYLVHLGAALRWAVSQKLMPILPSIELPQLAKKSNRAKGRPLSGEEIERMLAIVPKKVHASSVASWQNLILGLSLSGLRLSEALSLSWDDTDAIRVDLSCSPPMLLIPSEREKGRQTRILPITPDFAELLSRTPENQRTGRVFVLTAERKGRLVVCNMQYVSARISDIGKAAGIRVGTYAASGKVKYASAHDLRRSFGRRWASRVRNAVDLQALMRHESIETTLSYYALEDAKDLAADLWQRFANTSANSSSDSQSDNHSPSRSLKSTSAKLPRKDSNLD